MKLHGKRYNVVIQTAVKVFIINLNIKNINFHLYVPLKVTLYLKKKINNLPNSFSKMLNLKDIEDGRTLFIV